MAPGDTDTPEEWPSTLYFAYGSNLHLKQMKRRCPRSRFIGRGTLKGYRWQINERGYANICEAKDHHVDGLVYEIDKDDEGRLDVNEGVAKNAYTKRYLKADLSYADNAFYRRPVAWIVEQGGPSKVNRQAGLRGLQVFECGDHIEQIVLVYISFACVIDSSPREEYIARLNDSVRDATALGIPQSYVQDSIRRFIPEPEENPGPASSGAEKSKRGTKKPNTLSHTIPVSGPGL